MCYICLLVLTLEYSHSHIRIIANFYLLSKLLTVPFWMPAII